MIKDDRTFLKLSIISVFLLLLLNIMRYKAPVGAIFGGSTFLHLSIIMSILNGNFPWQDPHYLGGFCYYPWLQHFIIALLHRLTGISLVYVFNGWTIIQTIGLMLGYYLLGKTLKNEKLGVILAVLILLPRSTLRVELLPWPLYTSYMLIPIFLMFMYRSFGEGKPRYFVYAGTILGLSLLFHVFTFLMLKEELFSILTDAGLEISQHIMEADLGELSKRIGDGADGTPTLAIDRESETIFLQHLKRNGVPYNVISEERGFLDMGSDKNLIVDPLDGTTNAIFRIPYYSLSVALSNRNGTILEAAFVMNLYDKTVYTSVLNEGSYRNGRRITVSKGSGIYIINYGNAPDNQLRKIIRKSRKYRKFGSTALDLCLLASGSVDAVINMGGSSSPRNFDVAAGKLIVEEAGGHVVDSYGRPYTISLSPSVKKDMVAVASKSMVDDII